MVQLTAELLVDRLEPSDVSVSRDGTLVAFVVTPVGRVEERAQSSIRCGAADGSRLARQVTAGTAEDKAPRWAPDGKMLYFLRTGPKRRRPSSTACRSREARQSR